MAKKKAAGAKAKQGSNVAGKRLGIKSSAGTFVKPGQIIIRQRGKDIFPGKNVGMGKDFTLFAKKEGKVEFVNKNRSKKKVNVIEQS